MPEPAIDKTEYAYEASAASCAHAYLSAPLKKLVQSLGKSGTVLDLGCGNGSFSHELSKLGFEVYGIDRSASGIQIAREAFPKVQFTLGDVEEDLSPDPFQADSFDVFSEHRGCGASLSSTAYDPERLPAVEAVGVFHHEHALPRLRQECVAGAKWEDGQSFHCALGWRPH